MEKIEEIKSNQSKVGNKVESNFTLEAINIEALKKKTKKKTDLDKDQQELQRPKSNDTSPKLQRTRTCLCSPTTHEGSFRCRFHRSPGTMIRGYSVGSKLSELAGSKSPY